MTINADSRSRGIASVSDLRANSRAIPLGCWHWLGAMEKGTPRIWTFDNDKGDKTVLSGPRAVWNIAFGTLRGRIAYMGCFNRDCVNPLHVRAAANRAEHGAAIARSGARKGKQTAEQLASAAKGRAAQGIVDTPVEIVEEIRAAPPDITGRQLAEQFGLSFSTVCRIRRRDRRAAVAEAA